MQIEPNSLHLLPEIPGVYIFKNSQNTILYIGKAKNLKKRVSTYFQNIKNKDEKLANLVKQVQFIETAIVNYEFEALLLEVKLINLYQPKYNVIWKDDKHYIYVKITDEEFPRILLSRREDDSKVSYFGPFPSSRIVKDILHFVRTIFPFCTQNPNIKKPCFYTHLGLCYSCPSEIRKLEGIKYLNLRKKYLNNIRQIKNLFRGKISKVNKYLKNEMEKFSQNYRFEEAAIYRDKIQNLDYLLKQYFSPEVYIQNPQLAKQTWKIEQKELSKILSNYFDQLKLLKRIECYDVSNTFGSLVVGSMVTFMNNQPAKQFYRRFRMRIQNKINDFAALSEMLKRRLNHPEWGMPDLLVVDGGTPQCRTFQNVLSELSINIPFLGIAKEDEALVVPKGETFARIMLPRKSPALHLIQRVRDEAHRFAHKYHSLLRLKYMLNLSNSVKHTRCVLHTPGVKTPGN